MFHGAEMLLEQREQVGVGTPRQDLGEIGAPRREVFDGEPGACFH